MTDEDEKNEKLRGRLKKFLGLLGSSERGEAESAWRKIDRELRRSSQTWPDLIAIISGGAVRIIRLCERIGLAQLFARLNERDPETHESVRQEILSFLVQRRKRWNDLVELLSLGKNMFDWEPASDPADLAALAQRPLDLIERLLERHVWLTEVQRIAITLWVVHTFIFQQYSITPRLVPQSPVEECGKTTLLSLIKELAFEACRYDSVTPASLVRLINQCWSPTLLIDEGDNQNLSTNAILRAFLNSGHRYDGRFTRVINGKEVSFSTFAPVALAVIGRLPSLPFLSRSIVIRMERKPANTELEEFDLNMEPGLARMCQTVYEATFAWTQKVQFDPNPKMPDELRNRARNNWRALLAVADAQGPGWGKRARNAALALSAGRHEDPGILLLRDIHKCFEASPADRLSTVALLAALIALEDTWAEWRGPKKNQPPHPLTPGDLAQLLDLFEISSRTVWPRGPRAAGESAKGFYRGQFKRAWAAYCDITDTDDTASQESNFKRLRGHTYRH
jgi:Protein of unknown function (DUF3631)